MTIRTPSADKKPVMTKDSNGKPVVKMVRRKHDIIKEPETGMRTEETELNEAASKVTVSRIRKHGGGGEWHTGTHKGHKFEVLKFHEPSEEYGHPEAKHLSKVWVHDGKKEVYAYDRGDHSGDQKHPVAKAIIKHFAKQKLKEEVEAVLEAALSDKELKSIHDDTAAWVRRRHPVGQRISIGGNTGTIVDHTSHDHPTHPHSIVFKHDKDGKNYLAHPHDSMLRHMKEDVEDIAEGGEHKPHHIHNIKYSTYKVGSGTVHHVKIKHRNGEVVTRQSTDKQALQDWTTGYAGNHKVNWDKPIKEDVELSAIAEEVEEIVEWPVDSGSRFKAGDNVIVKAPGSSHHNKRGTYAGMERGRHIVKHADGTRSVHGDGALLKEDEQLDEMSTKDMYAHPTDRLKKWADEHHDEKVRKAAKNELRKRELVKKEELSAEEMTELKQLFSEAKETTPTNHVYEADAPGHGGWRAVVNHKRVTLIGRDGRMAHNLSSINSKESSWHKGTDDRASEVRKHVTGVHDHTNPEPGRKALESISKLKWKHIRSYEMKP